MTDVPDASFVSLKREVVDALRAHRYKLVLSLLDVLDARARDEVQRMWLRDVRGSVEAALRLERDGTDQGSDDEGADAGPSR